MIPEGIFSTLLDRVVQGSAGALAGVVGGVAVTAYHHERSVHRTAGRLRTQAHHGRD